MPDTGISWEPCRALRKLSGRPGNLAGSPLAGKRLSIAGKGLSIADKGLSGKYKRNHLAPKIASLGCKGMSGKRKESYLGFKRTSLDGNTRYAGKVQFIERKS